MRFRPCIDIHNGKVKQIVGDSLRDEENTATENFVSVSDAAHYALLYETLGLKGGHVIMLNPASSPYYADTKAQALSALNAWPGGMQVGGGINDENAAEFLDAGASHVIVTSYVFHDGELSLENLNRLVMAVGKEHLVLDLSCRKKDDKYYIVTDRWQKFTKITLDMEVLEVLSAFCDEFLIHAADIEGKQTGMETEVVRILSRMEGFPITYAGGINNYDELRRLKTIGENRLDVTIGSALKLFGGHMELDTILDICENE